VDLEVPRSSRGGGTINLVRRRGRAAVAASGSDGSVAFSIPHGFNGGGHQQRLVRRPKLPHLAQAVFLAAVPHLSWTG
jgi:hypothetical protein